VSPRSHIDVDGREGDVVLVKTTMNVEELARLYVGERLSAAEVGQRIGRSETTVRRRLHAHGMDIRSPGPRVRAPTSDEWTRERAYAIGLLATDGNLSSDGRHLRGNPRLDLGKSVASGSAILGASLRAARVPPTVALDLLRPLYSVLGPQESAIRAVSSAGTNKLEWSPGFAGVAKLANAPHSKCGARKGLRVRVPPPAPTPVPR
jgi:hypothetical protein